MQSPGFLNLLKTSVMKYAASLGSGEIERTMKDADKRDEYLESMQKAHWPNPQRRPLNIGNLGVVPHPTVIINDDTVPHLTREGKQVMKKAYVLTDPENPESAKKLVTIPSMLRRGMDRKIVRKAMYNEKRAAAGRWCN